MPPSVRESILPVRVVSTSPRSPRDTAQRSGLYRLIYPTYLLLVGLVVFVLYDKVLGHVRPNSRLLAEQYPSQVLPSNHGHTKELDPACTRLWETRICAHQSNAEELYKGIGSLQGFRALWQQGIWCFDMDAVMTKDGQVVVTHPKRIQAALAANSTMHNITDALETDVQNLELPELRKRGLDSDVFPGIVEILETYAALIDGEMSRNYAEFSQLDITRIPIMFLEFKDRAFNAATVSQVSDVVKRLRLEKYVALFLVSDSQQEQLKAEEFQWDGLYIRGFMDAKKNQTGEMTPEMPVIRPDLISGHTLVGPSIKLPETFFSELNDVTNHQPSFIWNVDDDAAIRKANKMEAIGLISNRPMHIWYRLQRLREACAGLHIDGDPT